MLSADGDEERKVAALDDGADDYLTKPFSMPELLARVRVALRHRRALASVATTGLAGRAAGHRPRRPRGDASTADRST